MIQKFSIECLEEDLIIEVTGDTRIQCYFTAVVWANKVIKSYRAILPVNDGKAAFHVTYESLSESGIPIDT